MGSELCVVYEKAVNYESRLRYTEAKIQLKSLWDLWTEVTLQHAQDLSDSLRQKCCFFSLMYFC